ncbi:MAG: ATP-grasp domain-containing protein [Proteobacteria bacterium]|nr:ATP-grasp domain-containing protein [Pseudomonadota bacterium]MBU4287949.1 ATP-grasp domain-containing protein [Pseudomonadota bacterium]
MTNQKKVIALEARLRGCRNVITIGVRTNFSDYSPQDADLIRSAEKIYYPTTFYADLFDAMGKSTFPSYHTYKFVQDKIKQTALFDLLKISHPRTRVFYGKRQKRTITEYFKFPFIGKVPRGSAMGRGVYLIKNEDDLSAYLNIVTPAYIQEYIPSDRDIRIVVIGNKIVHSYWRIAPPGDFRSNIAVGATVCLDPVPEEALDLALHTAQSCRWDDVGIDICMYNDKYYVLEANMKYGKEGFRKAGIDYIKLMEDMIENEEL